MEDERRNLLVVITHGIDHELSSAGPTTGLGGMALGLKGSIFLTSAGADVVRRGAAATTHVQPLEPLADRLAGVMCRSGNLWAFRPCVKSRRYVEDRLIDGVVITSASVMHELIKDGAATLSF